MQSAASTRSYGGCSPCALGDSPQGNAVTHSRVSGPPVLWGCYPSQGACVGGQFVTGFSNPNTTPQVGAVNTGHEAFLTHHPRSGCSSPGRVPRWTGPSTPPRAAPDVRRIHLETYITRIDRSMDSQSQSTKVDKRILQQCFFSPPLACRQKHAGHTYLLTWSAATIPASPSPAPSSSTRMELRCLNSAFSCSR